MGVAACTVWWATPLEPESAPGLVALLDGHERERLARFRRPADAARYLGAHALTRLVLGELVGLAPAAVPIERTCRCGEPHGKPTTPGGPGFSLTHAGGVVGVSVWPDGPVGLDVEPVRDLPDLTAIMRHTASPAELTGGPTGVEGFFAAWTRKEALLKATGDGLAGAMSAITLDGAAVRGWTGEHAPAGPVWLRDLSPAPGYAAAVAGLGPAPRVVQQRGDRALRASAGR